MNKKEFKERWESNASGGGITFDDIADCAKKWGLYQKPRIHPIDRVLYEVLKEANTNDFEKYNPDKMEI